MTRTIHVLDGNQQYRKLTVARTHDWFRDHQTALDESDRRDEQSSLKGQKRGYINGKG